MTDESAIVALARKLGHPDPDSVALSPRTFPQKSRDKMAKSGSAQSDGSFPIPDVDALKRAIQAIGRAKNPAKTKAHIKARAKALGATNLIPDGW